MIWQWYIDKLRIYLSLSWVIVCGLFGEVFYGFKCKEENAQPKLASFASFAWLYVIGQLQRSVEVPYAVF